MGNVPAGSLFARAQRVAMRAPAFIKVVVKGVFALLKVVVKAVVVLLKFVVKGVIVLLKFVVKGVVMFSKIIFAVALLVYILLYILTYSRHGSRVVPTWFPRPPGAQPL